MLTSVPTSLTEGPVYIGFSVSEWGEPKLQQPEATTHSVKSKCYWKWK